MKSVLLFCVFAISPFAQTTGASPVATPDKPPATGTKTKTKKVTGSASTVKKTQGDPGKVAASAAPLNDSAPAPKVQTPKTAETTAGVSPTQVNSQPPSATAAGPAQVVVVPIVVNTGQFAPGLFATASPYLVAQHADNSYVTAANPARQGEVIVLWGTGFGPANPAAGPLANAVTVTIGGQPAAVDFVGAVAGGLFQINVHVPFINDGDAGVVATVLGVSTPTTGNLVSIGGNPVRITSISSPSFVASGDTADVQYLADGANLVELSAPAPDGTGQLVIAALSTTSGTFSFAVRATQTYTLRASSGTFKAWKTFTINSGSTVCAPYTPPSFDARTASIAFNNDGRGSVDVRLYNPADPTRPFSGQAYSIPQGANYFLGSPAVVVRGDWGVRVGDSCPVSVGSSAPYYAGHNWQESGNTAHGLTTQGGNGTP